jgi:hypothetical protein
MTIGILAKPEPTKRVRARAKRTERAVVEKVRAACVERDGHCRLAGRLGPCEGESYWCHMEGKRRSQTRRMKPEARHDTAWTVMLCARHAEMEERHRVRSQYLSARGANGPMLWTTDRGPAIWELDR